MNPVGLPANSRKAKEERISLRIDKGLKHDFTKMCHARHIRPTDAVREAVRNMVTRHKKSVRRGVKPSGL